MVLNFPMACRFNVKNPENEELREIENYEIFLRSRREKLTNNHFPEDIADTKSAESSITLEELATEREGEGLESQSSMM